MNIDTATSLGKLDRPFMKIRSTSLRVFARFLVVGIVCATAGFGISAGMNKAFGDEPAGGHAARECVSIKGDPCPSPRKYAVYKFKHGKMGRSHGVNQRRVFVNPAAARRVWIKKINHELARSKTARLMARGMTASQLYGRAMRTSDCVGDTHYAPYSTGFNLCEFDGPKITTDDIKKMGSATFCGGGLVLGAVTDGTSMLMLGWGGASCFWGAWLSM